MLSDEEKKHFLANFLENIKGISDKKYQEKVWILGEGPEFDNFDETTCNFFYFSEPILRNPKDFRITDVQYASLQRLTQDFKKFADENDFPLEFIDSPEWTRIAEMAKDVLKAFHYRKE